jgi:flavin reductase (DIM6/NTAB) family NADH-FMN oxidoreductase RutF
MAITAEEMRHVMRHWATGVSLVTSAQAGRSHGMTVTSFASIALDPPLLLVSLKKTTRTNTMVHQSKHFAVVLLADDQQELSDQFAGRLPDDDYRFAEIPYFTTDLGSPIPEGSLAYMDCRLVESHDAATHTIFIGRVESSRILNQKPPLLYYDQNYARLDQ